MSQIKHLVNGQPTNSIEVTNRGIAYGDGLFETIRFQESEPILWNQHWRRMRMGCQALALNLPEGMERDVLEQCRWLAEQYAQPIAVLKIILLRAGAGRGYRPAENAGIDSIVSISSLPVYARENYLTGIDVKLCETRLANNPPLAGIKHLNRLEQILATREWSEPVYQEGLMMDTVGRVIEGTRSNVFFVNKDRILTPGLEDCGIKGVLREYLLRGIFEPGLQVSEGEIALEDLTGFQEAFVCNSLFGIWPVRSLELANNTLQKWPVGKITHALQQMLADRLHLEMS